MAMALRPCHLVLLSLGIGILAHAAAALHPTATATSQLPLPTSAVQDTPSSPRLLHGHLVCDRSPAPPSPTTFTGDFQPRRLVACYGVDNNASPRAAPPHTPSLVPATRGVTSSDNTRPTETKAPLDALPLLAVPFLPPPVAALVALSYLATRVGARSDDCFKLNHATCAIYRYDNETGTIDRSRPMPDLDLGAVCLHPLCHADSDHRLLSVLHGQQHGRWDDPLHIYCTVRTLDGEGALSILPWRNTWRVHLPIADPVAAAASGGDVCYVELAHLDYREGYYIHCPVGEQHQTYCTEFPEEAIAAAVWEHRSLSYRATVGPRYARYSSKYAHDEL
ncbi:hypothetical protein ACP70R_022426 [Stipagrostis hirtigluma subsp. patula]